MKIFLLPILHHLLSTSFGLTRISLTALEAKKAPDEEGLEHHLFYFKEIKLHCSTRLCISEESSSEEALSAAVLAIKPPSKSLFKTDNIDLSLSLSESETFLETPILLEYGEKQDNFLEVICRS